MTYALNRRIFLLTEAETRAFEPSGRCSREWTLYYTHLASAFFICIAASRRLACPLGKHCIYGVCHCMEVALHGVVEEQHKQQLERHSSRYTRSGGT